MPFSDSSWQAVTVGVDPDVVTHRNLRQHEPEVQGWIPVAIGAQALGLGFPRRGIALALTPVSRVGNLRSQRLGRGLAVDLHRVRLAVLQNRQVLEGVLAVFIGLGRLTSLPNTSITGLPSGPSQGQDDILDALFALVLAAVTVGIDPDVVTHRNLRQHEPEVQRRIPVAVAGQALGRGFPRRGIALAFPVSRRVGMYGAKRLRRLLRSILTV